MTNEASPRTSIFSASMFLLVSAILISPIGAIVIDAIADTGGGSASTSVVPDTISDAVAATAAEFRVDESGSATYSIPLYGVPGTAGVAPKLSLGYSSQGGYGPLGKGWSIGGMSSIARCRATREAGDVAAESNPAPINFSATDRYCLDGQRLLAVPNNPVCATVGGMGVQQLRTEIESFVRVCAYTPTSGTNGPSFFTVERKDGSTSWYGDRDNNATANRADGYFETNSPLKPAAALLWAQTRFQDSTGNYIDFIYSENPAGASTREHLISEIRYTGKTVLSGQTGSAKAPYAKIIFNYGIRAAAQQAKGYSAGGTLDQTRRLDSITSCASAAAGACAAANQARYYQLTYAATASGSGLDTLTSLQECKDSGKAVCIAPTTFSWSAARNEFATSEDPSSTLGNWFSPFQGMKWGDVDGDGRQDMVYVLEGSSGGTCTTEAVYVAFSTLDSANRLSFVSNGKKTCTPAELLPERGNGAWHLLDYNGDGRDDLMLGAGDGQPWRIYPSVGRDGNATKVFDDSQNLLASLIPAMPSDLAEDRQPQLADLNGDGLLDVIYPDGSQLAARLMERNGAGFNFGADRPIVLQGASIGCFGINTSCTYWFEPTSFLGVNQLFDLNGDGSSDVLVQVNKNVTRQPDPDCVPEPGLPCQPTTTQSVSVWPHVVTKIEPTQITLTAYGSSALPVIPGSQAGDFNGDGLTDFLTVNESTDIVLYAVNTGTGFSTWTNLGVFPNSKHLKVADVNGDGRSDLVYPNVVGSNKAYVARLALPQGGFAPEAALAGGGAIHCAGSGCNADNYISLFGDYDGDGAIDHVRFDPDSSNTGIHVSRAGTASQFVPRDVITRITNGLGAQTDINYAPLTNKDLYRRDTGSRNNLSWGRGSPVMDLLAPSYAVARASSSSPQAGAPAAKATVHYRYAGARMQSGGRGFLGFAVIDTIDPNQTGGHVVTTTSYAQNFPFVGMPVRTVKKAVANMAYLLPACLNGTAVTNACFATPGQPHVDLGGSWFSDSGQVWESAPAVLTNQVPLHVRTFGTDEKLRDPFTGSQTSEVMTNFTYGGYSNVASTSVLTYTGASTLVSSVATTNLYTDDLTKWRLGRLTSSTVTHSRPGMTNVVRTSNFAYSSAGAYTGLLTVERSQSGGPADQDLRKEYTYDEYGNKTIAETCADPATACTTAISFHPASATAIQRYSKVTYDAIGRYPVSTIEPYWNGAGAVEKTVNTVVARNIFGDATQAYDLNGADTLAVAGTLGRPYYSWAETVAGSTPGTPSGGVESRTTYRFCGSATNQVNCPTGARFRQQVVAEGAPRQWTYFDVLGRPVLKSAETFNVNVIGKDVAATCTDYDATGKPSRVSNPFFLAGTGGTDGPTGLDAVCTAGTRLWTTTTYDLLGRPTRIETPDPNGSAAVTTAYNNLTTDSRDARNNLTKSVRNGKGELVQVVDAAGLVMNYSYAADGNLLSVTRNAGRGVITNSFGYDVLGRKTSQDDPDSGLSQFQYNALGELIVQIDASGQRIENEYDARGRAWRKTSKTSAGVVESQSTFTYDTAANGAGQLASETVAGIYSAWAGQTPLAHSYARSATYDTFGRGSTTATTIDSVAYPGSVAYDTLGRAWKGQDASGRWVKTEFDARGAAVAVCNSSAADAVATCPADANTYVRTLATDEWGHVTKERRGNSAAMEVNRAYYTQNGRVAEICGGTSAGCNLMKESYGWDTAGNLSTRTKENRYLETFLYDSLNRLQEAKMVMEDGITANQVLLAQVYDKLGNICQKAEGGETRDYTYIGRAGCGTGGLPGSGGSGIAGPHQVTVMSGGTPLYYDPQGNQTIDNSSTAPDGSTFRYSADNHAYELNIGPLAAPTKRLRFWYGPDGQRYKQDDAGEKTLYVGGVEIVVQGATTTFRRYLGGVAVQTVSGAVVTTKYMFQDQQGSLVRLANADGTVAESLDYAPYGKPRSYADPDVLINPLSTAFTPRGFTGHEHLPSTGIIHMNGRIYSPKRGRFLQPDPVIQSPNNAQSWNAYTYVFNNPTTYTDPTGMMSERGWNNLWMAAGIAVSIISAGAASPYFAAGTAAGTATGMAIVAAGGFVAGYATTGTLKGAVTGAFTAAITAGIANGGWNIYQQIAAQAVTGGVMESLQGGNFGHGFVSAGLTAAFMPHIGGGNRFVRAVKGALIGGTISELTGGKFANGAISGAIQGAMSRQSQTVEAQAQDPEPALSTIRNNVENNKYFESSVDPVTGEMLIRVPYGVDQSISGGDETRIVSSIQDKLSGTYKDAWGRELGLKVELYRPVSIDVGMVLSSCPANVCGVRGFAAAWVNPRDPGIFSKHLLVYGPASAIPSDTFAHEFLHVAGLGHQWNSTQSLMSYSNTRSLIYSDVERLYNAYK